MKRKGAALAAGAVPLALIVVMTGTPSAVAVPAAELPAVPAQDTGTTVDVAVGESIQAAVDDVAAAGGGTVNLASGRHNISAPIELRSGVALQGQGRGGDGMTTIYNDLGTDMVIMLDGRDGGLSDVIVKDLKVDCALTREQRDYTSDPGRNYGVYVTDEAAANERVLLDSVQITACAVGFHVKGTSDLTIRDSDIHDNGGYEFYFHNAYLRRVSRASIENTRLANSHSGNGVNISYCDNITVSGSTLSGNHFRGVRAAESEYIDVLGNTATGNGDSGIIMNSEGSGTHHFRIHDNTVDDNLVGIATSSNSSDGEVWYNTVAGNGTDLDVQSAATTIR
jgi:parallel beta-helix repeat protein